MRIKLDKGYIYVADATVKVTNSYITINVDFENQDASNYFWVAYINGTSYPFTNTITIPWKKLVNCKEISLNVTGTKGDETLNYKADIIPLSVSLHFGKDTQEAYPEWIYKTNERLDTLEKAVYQLATKGDIK